MKKVIVRIFTLVILLSLMATPVFAQTATDKGADQVSPQDATPTRPLPEEVPQEIQDLFKDGMSVEDFLAQNQGPIPNALMQYADLPLVAIVQLEQPSLIDFMGSQKGVTGEEVTQEVQKSYTNELTAKQDAVINQIEAAGVDATVMGRYTKVLNGFMLRLTYRDLSTIRSLPGVKSVSKAPEHTVNLSHSVPLIKADSVWTMDGTGYTGKSVRVAVIDTGIDYTHAMFSTLGDPAAYADNDPNVIEPGTFPTPKVIGGYDFAGTNYDAGSDDPARLIPVSDPDPLDEGGHGTHVSSTVAGVDAGFGSGVAPEASLYALKVFGAEGSTNLVVDAIEWAVDPNQDGYVNDHVDVINMSLGSSFGPAIPDDPEYLAVEAANTIGVFVVASAGNAGDVSYVTGSPANTDSALSVAASTTGYQTLPYISYEGGEIPYTTSYNPFETAISADLVDVVDYGNTSGQLCTTTNVSRMDGKIALIVRGGGCTFAVKINNAENLGAIAAIIYNNVPGTIAMNTSGSTLPAGSILQSDGLLLKGLAPLAVTVGPDSKVKSFESATPADTISDFSSRGPRGYDSMLKPEITAPGTDIFAANMGSGNQGVSMSGTSMAAPHITGVVALMKQAHPTWSNEEIKAAIMNTAVDLADPESQQVPRQGAGRVDALAAVTTKVVAVADPKFVSLNWGLLQLSEDTYVSHRTITLHNFSDQMVTLNTAAMLTSPISEGATITTDVPSVDIPAYGKAVVNVTLTLDVTQLPIDFGNQEEYYGYVTFTGADANLRVPFYFVPRPYGVDTKVDAETTFDYQATGFVDLEQSGPVASSLWAYPVTLVSDNDPSVLDMADLRYVGVDYGDSSPYGDIVVPAFSMWGAQHDEQPYWSEVDMTIYGDAPQPIVDFNYNYASVSGAAYPDNQWVVVQVDYNDGNVYLGSPYFIYADFNSGFQEWYLPAPWNYVTDKFSYSVSSFDWYGQEDYAGTAQFDLSRPPLAWATTDGTYSNPLSDPHNEAFALLFEVNDLGGYLYSAPKGIMLVDYFGKPGIGQATYWPLTVTGIPTNYLPVIQR